MCKRHHLLTTLTPPIKEPEPDYAASIYYHTAYVGASISDVNDTLLASGSQQNYGRAELNLQASGNGNPPYKIRSGHFVFLSYYVSNYWDSYAYAYRTGYLDYNYYNYFTSGAPGSPCADVPFSFPLSVGVLKLSLQAQTSCSEPCLVKSWIACWMR